MSQLTTPADLILTFDERTIRELVLDDGAHPQTVDLDTNPVLLRLLSVAETHVKSALKKGGRYTEQEFTDLPEESANFLKHIVCQFAMLDLISRRPRFDAERYAAHEKLSKTYLEALQNGDVILGTNEADVLAGRANVDGPTVIDVFNRNGMTTASKYFPTTRLPIGRQ